MSDLRQTHMNGLQRVDSRLRRSLGTVCIVLNGPLVIASDGLWGWGRTEAECAAALDEIERVLSPGGHAILTEHLRPARFREFVQSIAVSRLAVSSVACLADRPSYQLEATLKAVRSWRVARALPANRLLAQVLRMRARPFGPSSSRHILVIARRSRA